MGEISSAASGQNASGQESLSKRNLWAFSLGGIGRDMCEALWSGFLMTFVIYTKSLTASQFAAISMLAVAARVLNVICDPVMGNILEVTRTRWGKFKPWITIGMICSSLVFYISFSNTLGGWSYVALFGVMYFTFSIVFSMIDISSWGMLPSLAVKKEDRDLLTSRTVLLSGIGAGAVWLIVPVFTVGDLVIGGNALTAYSTIVKVFCAFFIGMQMITLIGVKEKPLPPKGNVNTVSIKTIIKTVRNNDQLMWCILIFFLNSVASGILNSALSTSYLYFEFGYNGMLITVFMALGAAATGLVMLFFTPISKRFSRQWLMRAATVSAVAGYAIILLAGLFMPKGPLILNMFSFKFIVLMFGNLFAFAGQNTGFLILMICIANTVEYNEWKTGDRAEGIIFSMRPLITKLGYAAIQFIVMCTFLLTGVRDFTNGISDLENAAEQGLITEIQKSDMIKSLLETVPGGKSAALLACMTVIPAILAYGTYYFYKKRYTIDEESYDRMLEEISNKKAENTHFAEKG